MTEVINNISDFEKYLKNTRELVEEAEQQLTGAQ